MTGFEGRYGERMGFERISTSVKSVTYCFHSQITREWLSDRLSVVTMARNNEFDSSSISVLRGQRESPAAQEITRHLHVPLGRSHVGRFSDGEVECRN